MNLLVPILASIVILGIPVLHLRGLVRHWPAGDGVEMIVIWALAGLSLVAIWTAWRITN